MQMAERFNLPIITFIDTPGAYPGIGAEERGQSEAIARNLREMSTLKVPVICTVIGEGGSGGALAIGVGRQSEYVAIFNLFCYLTRRLCFYLMEKRRKSVNRSRSHGLNRNSFKRVRFN